MRRGLLRALLLVAAGVALGLASAWWSVKRVPGLGASAAGGPWRVSLLAGSPDADLHTRARVALGGLLALSRRETVYYLAQHDSSGAPLRSRCTYRVGGPVPAARWWSVTAYADDLFLFDTGGTRRHSVNAAQAGGGGHFAFVSAPQAPAAAAGDALPWLPTPGDRGLVFALRLYQPGPAAFVPPRIEPQGACP
jgi:hypothetical protein